MRHEELIDEPCSIIRPLSVLGDRWTFMLVKEAFAGTHRFEDFQSHLGISRSRLSDRLDRLVREDILKRVPYKDGRTRYEYRLSPKGFDLYVVMLALREWGDRYMAPDGPPVYYRHTGCSGEARVRITCEACGDELSARDVSPIDGPGRGVFPAPDGAEPSTAGPLR